MTARKKAASKAVVKAKPKKVAKPAPTESSTEQMGRALDEIIMAGDISSLTVPQRSEFLSKLALSMKLNPLSQPFELIVLNDKLTIYAKKGASDQLREKNKCKVDIIEKGFIDDAKTAYFVMIKIQTPDKDGLYDTPGCRSEIEMGCAGTDGVTGEALGNAIMKAITKAKRRGGLSFTGFGGLDELEVDSITAAKAQAAKGGVGQPTRLTPRLSPAPVPASTPPIGGIAPPKAKPVTLNSGTPVPAPAIAPPGATPVILPPVKPPVSTK